MELSSKLKIIIAKSGQENRWLPLWIHSEDVVHVMRELLHSRYSMLSETCEMEFDLFKKTAILLAYLHDIGKLTPLFQSKILKRLPERRSVFEHYGISGIAENFIDQNKSHHTKCGEAILRKLNFSEDFSSIIGAHHGMPVEEIKDHMDCYPEHYYGYPRNDALWLGLYEEWVTYALEKAGFSDISKIPELHQKTEVLLSGLLIMADWLASDTAKFALLDEDADDEYIQNRYDNVLEKIRPYESWEADREHISEDDFKQLFGFSMNKMQKTVIKKAERCAKPGLFILEAPMGMGKTEAALSMSEIFASKCNKTGLFFGLPTQVTANGIFERVVNWAREQQFDISINLVHKNAEFQPVFVKLKQDSIPQTDFDGEEGLTVNSFFSGNKKSLLADFVVGTVDRLLMCALKKKHAMLLHLGLSQKVVIIDECHAYDAYMNQYLNTALAWLHEYGVPVILLSATLPLERRNEFVKAYLNNKKQDIHVPEVKYPRLTYIDGTDVNAISLPLEETERSIEIICCNDDIAMEKIADAVRFGACVGVICNTVLRAQRFAEMVHRIGGATVILYHAQFIIPDRIEKEDMLKKATGKTSTSAGRKGMIVIGTQVLEQSLDIDFDVLFTDLCPMDLLLQRIGRLHRHQRNSRPNGYENPKCYVLDTERLDGPSSKIYTEWLLLRTKKLLPSNINIPSDIELLVDETYRSIEPSGDEECMAYKRFKDLQNDKKQRAQGYLMAVPKESRYFNNLRHWLSNSTSDDENSAIAAVRDGTYTVEVIVLVQEDNSLSLLPWRSNGKKYALDLCPSEDDGQLIAQQKLRLPMRFNYDINRTINELEVMDQRLLGFQKSHWLKGELVLLLDKDLNTHLCGFQITYSQENGLTYKKEEYN